ncbi:hypothetical protein DIPPA_25211 [Diplonema papillatum]|nr:hypothetical protein DIPPA_25211 [Diplonema papillatum]
MPRPNYWSQPQVPVRHSPGSRDDAGSVGGRTLNDAPSSTGTKRLLPPHLADTPPLREEGRAETALRLRSNGESRRETALRLRSYGESRTETALRLPPNGDRKTEAAPHGRLAGGRPDPVVRNGGEPGVHLRAGKPRGSDEALAIAHSRALAMGGEPPAPDRTASAGSVWAAAAHEKRFIGTQHGAPAGNDPAPAAAPAERSVALPPRNPVRTASFSNLRPSPKPAGILRTTPSRSGGDASTLNSPGGLVSGASRVNFEDQKNPNLSGMCAGTPASTSRQLDYPGTAVKPTGPVKEHGEPPASSRPPAPSRHLQRPPPTPTPTPLPTPLPAAGDGKGGEAPRQVGNREAETVAAGSAGEDAAEASARGDCAPSDGASVGQVLPLHVYRVPSGHAWTPAFEKWAELPAARKAAAVGGGLAVAGLAVFAILSIAAVAGGAGEQPYCFAEEGREWRYTLVNEWATVEGASSAVTLRDVRDVCHVSGSEMDIAFLHNPEGEPPYGVVKAPVIATASVLGRGDVVLKALSARSVLYDPRRIASEGTGGIWAADAMLHMVMRLDVRHPLGVSTAIGSYGAAGNGYRQFDTPVAVAAAPDGMLVLDKGNARLGIFNVTGQVAGWLADSRLGAASDLVVAGDNVYVAAGERIFVYNWRDRTYVAAYSSIADDEPLSSLRAALTGEPRRRSVESLSATPSGHLLSVEGGQLVLRTLAGRVSCTFGSVRGAVAAAMLPDRRIVVAQKGTLQLFASRD